MGYATAEAAPEYGTNVIISSSNQEKIDKPIDSGKVFDLADPAVVEEDIKALLDFATQNGKLNHVVFTAGDALRIKGLDVSVDDIHQASMVRFTTAIIMAKYLPTYVTSSINSSYILTGGTSTWRPAPRWSVVAGLGGAVGGLSRGLAVDLKPVRTNCVEPGSIHTGLFKDIPADRLEGVLEGMAKGNIIEKVGTPEELAEAYLYFMNNSFVTGATVVVDDSMIEIRVQANSKPARYGLII